MDKNAEWNLLLAEEMGYDERLDKLTDDQVFAYMDELECGGRVIDDGSWEDIPY